MAKSASAHKVDRPFNATRRIYVLAFVGTGLFILLGARLADLQILRESYYDAVAQSQRERASELIPHRGIIYATEEGNVETSVLFPIATNQRGWIAYAVPRDISEPAQVAQELAPALLAFRQRQQDRVNETLVATGQEPREETDENVASDESDALEQLRDELATRLNKKRDPYEPLLRPYEILDDELRNFLAAANLPGIVVKEQEVRIYPEGSLAAHVLGFVGYEQTGKVGRYGIEGWHEQELAGDLGFLSSERDSIGAFIGVGDHTFKPATDGTDIVLTIDRIVQSFIEKELADGVTRYGAERGTIIVMEPETGAIRGMATFPTFDPNYYYAINDPAVQLNPAISEIFEPGSILKPLIMASAIEEEIVKPDTTMVDNGPIRVAEYLIDTYDSQHHGLQTMTQILEKSNNIGMVWVGQQLGAETMYDYLRRFGLGEKTGIQLEGETRTVLAEPDDWDVTTVATTSFGQGIALTPLQALNAINVFANRGQLVSPQIVSRTETADATTIFEPQVVRQAVSPATAEQISAMMVSVIENGVAQSARVPGYYLAGKTGTAQVPDERGRYSPDRKIIAFVGFGPVENPKFTILIKLDNPAGLSFASGTAAPMFRNLATKLLKYYQVAPSYEIGQQEPFRVTVPDDSGA